MSAGRGTILTMPVVLLLAALAILAGVVVVAVGRGGELAMFRPDVPARPQAFASAADVASFRPPPAFFGYSATATDEALQRITTVVAERDAEVAWLRGQIAELKGSAAEPWPGAPAEHGSEPESASWPDAWTYSGQAGRAETSAEPGPEGQAGRVGEPEPAGWAGPEAYAAPERRAYPGDWPKPEAYAEPDDQREPAARSESEAHAEDEGRAEPDDWPASGAYPEPEAGTGSADWPEPAAYAEPAAWPEPEPEPYADPQPGHGAEPPVWPSLGDHRESEGRPNSDLWSSSDHDYDRNHDHGYTGSSAGETAEHEARGTDHEAGPPEHEVGQP